MNRLRALPKGWKERVAAAWRVSRRSTYISILCWALAFTLPLALAAIGIARLIEADYVVMRQAAHDSAARLAARIGRDVGDAAKAQAAELLDRLLSRHQDEDPVVTARSLIYISGANATLLLRDGQPVFPPPDGWDMPVNLAARVSALQAAARLQPPAQPAGWYAGPDGPVFFVCRMQGALKGCVALDWMRIAPTIRSTLAASTSSLRGWALGLKDPFDNLVWSYGDPGRADAEAFDLAGPLNGWRLAAAAPADATRGIAVQAAVAAPIALAWFVLVGALIVRQRQRRREQEARAELMAQLSHDLRTPLANLKLYAALIARHSETGSPPAKIAGFCEVMDAEIDRLDSLAGDTIAFGTAAHRGRLEVAKPDDVLQQTIARLGRLLETAGCRCELDAGARRPCRFDRVSFERIVVNLIDNARKHAPGAIEITTMLEAGYLRLSVRDWGVDTAPKPHDGFGLGLKVVRDLARANEGTVEIVACAPGTRVDVTMRVDPLVAAT